jgi:hypothetical protein
MSSETSGRVYRLHSTLELPLEDVRDHFDGNPDLPEGVNAVNITRRNNTLILQAEASSDEISKYTPTAQLKASVTENRVYEEEPPDQRPGGRGGGGPQWGADEEEEMPPSEMVEFAAFKGDRETVLQNSTLQYQMFLVLCDIARLAEKGTLTAIASVGDALEAVRIVDGEDRAADVEVVEGPSDAASGDGGVDWRDNKFIGE